MSEPAKRIVKPDNVSVEQSFRESLEDVVTALDALSPYCATSDEAAGMAKLALENDGQLRLLLDLVTRNRR